MEPKFVRKHSTLTRGNQTQLDLEQQKTIYNLETKMLKQMNDLLTPIYKESLDLK